jgi:hypothetical protein
MWYEMSFSSEDRISCVINATAGDESPSWLKTRTRLVGFIWAATGNGINKKHAPRKSDSIRLLRP